MEEHNPPEETIHNALVALVIDKYKLVINRGLKHELRRGTRVLIYSISKDDIIDPATQRSLGRLELAKGTGVVTQVQEQLAVVEADREKIPRDATISAQRTLGRQIERMPFDDVQVSDHVKVIGVGTLPEAW